MWLRVLHIWFDVCYSLLSMLLCQKFYLCSNLCMFYYLIDFKPNVYLIFKTCPSMTNICTTIGLYAKSFDNQFSRGFQVSFNQIWPDMSAPFARHIWPNLSETSKSEITGHVWPLAQTYPVDRTYPAPQPNISGARAKGYKRGVLTPSNPRPLISSPLHSLRLQVLSSQFGDSSTESLGFLGDSSPLPLVFIKP
jgi:hypothetical protein